MVWPVQWIVFEKHSNLQARCRCRDFPVVGKFSGAARANRRLDGIPCLRVGVMYGIPTSSSLGAGGRLNYMLIPVNYNSVSMLVKLPWRQLSNMPKGFNLHPVRRFAGPCEPIKRPKVCSFVTNTCISYRRAPLTNPRDRPKLTMPYRSLPASPTMRNTSCI